MSATYQWIHRVWYEEAASGWVLLPLSGLYWLLLKIRAAMFRLGILRSYRARAPVIVVGNITAGGTGKTPIVIWLVRELLARGYVPGIVSRGYGGSRSATPMRVDANSEAAVVGDEPVLLARRTQCPVVVDADRVSAAQMLVEDGVNVIVADDGLQHLRLQRDFEICVIDGARGLGNGRLLPAGPLRESARRLQQVDQVLVNGRSDRPGAVEFSLAASEASRLNASLVRPLTGFSNTTVHAVAGIGNPQRFFDLLREHEIQVIEHAFPDHAAITRDSIEFGDDFSVFMTEKDAVKLGGKLPDKFWYVPVDLSMDTVNSSELMAAIETRLQTTGAASQ